MSSGAERNANNGLPHRGSNARALPLAQSCSLHHHMLIDGVGRRRGVETLVTKLPLTLPGASVLRCATRMTKSSPRSFPTPCLQWERRVGQDNDRDDEGGANSTNLDRTFRTLAPWLQRALASRFGYARPEIDDLVQKSFIRLGRYSVADRSRHPRALLLRIAQNLTVDAHGLDAPWATAALVARSASSLDDARRTWRSCLRLGRYPRDILVAAALPDRGRRAINRPTRRRNEDPPRYRQCRHAALSS